ncbi:MAG: DUF418 domain-containing protein, partial [Actinomycetota bacterium]
MTTSTTSPSAPTARPTGRGERHGFVDALRGFALLGILVVNIEFIVQPSEVGWSNYTSDIDRVVRALVIALGQTKVYPLFALLFGYGLALQLQKAEATGSDLWPRYRRRMVGLAILGVAHGVLFFPGDILVIYAVIGAVAFRLRRLPTHRLLRIAGWTYGVVSVLWLALGVAEAVAGASAGSGPSAPADVVLALSEGSFGDVVAVHAVYWIVTLGILSVVQGPAVFASFLAGVALGRTSLLADPDRHRDLALRMLRWAPLGLLAAGVGAGLTIAGGRWATLGFAVGFAAAPLVGAGYLAGLALALPHLRRLSRVLQATGRMSLTVYLLESVVASTLAYGYGAGLVGTTGPAAGVGLAVGIWLALTVFAVGWMRLARFGQIDGERHAPRCLQHPRQTAEVGKGERQP